MTTELFYAVETPMACAANQMDVSADEWRTALAALAKLREEWAATIKPPENDDWKAVIQFAYADGGDGVLRINRITAGYCRMRDERNEALRQGRLANHSISNIAADLLRESDRATRLEAALREVQAVVWPHQTTVAREVGNITVRALATDAPATEATR